jgi:hypothetical protein
VPRMYWKVEILAWKRVWGDIRADTADRGLPVEQGTRFSITFRACPSAVAGSRRGKRMDVELAGVFSCWIFSERVPEFSSVRNQLRSGFEIQTPLWYRDRMVLLHTVRYGAIVECSSFHVVLIFHSALTAVQNQWSQYGCGSENMASSIEPWCFARDYEQGQMFIS